MKPGKNFQSLFAHNTQDQPLALWCGAPYNARSPLVFGEGTFAVSLATRKRRAAPQDDIIPRLLNMQE